MNLPQGLQYGFIAQEFQEVLPNCVKESVIYTDTSMETEVNYDNTLLSITTQEVIPLLIKGGQGQQLEISSMSDEINQLNSQLSALENSINLLISE
jgi:hypothetical protein